MKISAFVGHSFLKEDEEVVREIQTALDTISSAVEGFTWDHAKGAEPKDLRDKVLAKIYDKNLFIGICTAKELVIDKLSLRQRFFFPKSFYAPKSAFSSKTSDWILQEIGLAIGRGLPLILLVEENLRLPGGLQGNLEYITFSRESPSKVMSKLIEMIVALKPEISKVSNADTSEPKAAEQSISETTPEKSIAPITSKSDWSIKDYENALFGAIFTQDVTSEESIVESFAASDFGKIDEQVAELKACRFYIHFINDNKDVSSDLRDLANQYPNVEGVLWRLAAVYRNQEQFDQASKIWEKLLVLVTKQESKISYGTQYAIAQARLSHSSIANSKLDELSRLPLAGDQMASIMKAKARVANISEEFALFCVLAEGALFLDPEDDSLRFDLAYKYSELGSHALAIKHYKLLSVKSPKELYFNNLGVSYSHIKAEGLSIAAYLKAKDFGSSLATSNLALRLISVGFYAQAETYCRDALKTDDCHTNVAHTLSLISRKIEEETELEKTELSSSLRTVEFFVEASQAAMKPKIKDGTYTFINEKYEYNIVIAGADLTANYETEILSPFNPFESEPTSKTKSILISLKGKVVGRVASFELKESEKGKVSTFLTEEKASKGILILDEAPAKIRYYNLDNKEISLHISK